LLNQEFVFTILQASLAGAGLVIAVYALVIPLLNKLFTERAETLTKLTKELREISKKMDITDSKAIEEKVEKLSRIGTEISGKISYPSYLSLGFSLTFIGYIISTLMCLQILVNPSAPISVPLDGFLVPLFGASTIGFGIVGGFSIKDTYSVLKKEFDETKKRFGKM
jgi:uncharacterized coiled-coil protein SlyX